MRQTYTVITGASSGIGYATALAFADRQQPLILIARREERLHLLKEEIHETQPELEVILKVCDLSNTENCLALYQELATYSLNTWINNAGFGHYDLMAQQPLDKILNMLQLNVEALTLFSTLFVRDYQDVPGAQLINVSSSGGYTIVPNAVTYCATKFFVSSLTEGIALELKRLGAPLTAKVLAPSATETEFANVANDTDNYDYQKGFGHYHTSQEMAEFLMALYDSSAVVGRVNRDNFELELTGPLLHYVGKPTS
ncbi:SDR family NAD(P)-dependent oxidoreductase [uncultured Vagococcus sp.]|uniref:SDR family NAD(P)-dependent oxidoreductase n=1 Tax=uncultured Vagococcus sp. TaxID=189676 RepID=UPI0028D54B8D|nr:SDR family NAD(P)-dependent oxidoreductase [uncultured Vagococcus sp.]